MALSKFTKDMAIIRGLDDEPNDVGGLTAAQLKAKFDEGGEALKQYLNETLLPALNGDHAAAELGAVFGGEETTIQKALDSLAAAGTQAGNVPAGGAAGSVLRKRSDEWHDLEWVQMNQFAAVPFTAAQWTKGEDGSFLLTIPRSDHGRDGESFGCVLRHRVNGTLASGTWAALGTQSAFDPDTGAVRLTAEDAYDGAALFYGPGVEETSGFEPVLLTEAYSGDGISADLNGGTYRLKNVGTDADKAADGTIIITKVEE